MAYLIFLLVLIVIFAAFLVLTAFEKKSGRRYFAASRGEFDTRVARAEFVLTHVDFAAFVRDTTKDAAEHAAHDITHFVLQAVRWVERQLTRAMRILRERRAEMMASVQSAPAAEPRAPQAQGEASEFARAMSGMKQELRAQREEGQTEASVEEPGGAVQ